MNDLSALAALKISHQQNANSKHVHEHVHLLVQEEKKIQSQYRRYRYMYIYINIVHKTERNTMVEIRSEIWGEGNSDVWCFAN